MNKQLKTKVTQLLGVATCVQLELWGNESGYQSIALRFNGYNYSKGGRDSDVPNPEIIVKYNDIKNFLDGCGIKLNEVYNGNTINSINTVYFLSNQDLKHFELKISSYNFYKSKVGF